MDEITTPCPKCGRPLTEYALRCPDCGTDVAAHVRRIRCNYCGRRIPASSTLCPYCRRNPRRLYLTPRWLFAAGLLLAAFVAIYAFQNVPAWYSALALRPTALPLPTGTATPTVIAQVILTATLSPSATPSATRTLTPTAVPSATRTATLRPTAVPTRVPTVRKPPTLPPPTSYPAPFLLSPADGITISGTSVPLQLTFQPQAPLPLHGWFQVQVLFSDRKNVPFVWCGYTATNSIIFPSDYWDDSWQLDRTFLWRARVVTSSATLPSTCAVSYQVVSGSSSLWTFYWR